MPQVQARSAGGKGGDWLLDPNAIIIGTGGPASDVSGNVYSGTTSAGNSYVSPSLLTTALAAGANVTVKTSGPASGATDEAAIIVQEPVTVTSGSGGGAA